MGDEIRFEDAALALRSQRMTVLASNIANADTPGYKARDFRFSEALANATRFVMPMQQTNAEHIATPLRSTVDLDYRTQLQPAMDGSSVDMDLELAAYSENSVRTQIALQWAMEEYIETGNMINSLKG